MKHDVEPSELRILLVRHGETDWNRTGRFQGRSDVPLNQKGREQGHALALALKDEPLIAIYSSPLARAMETARLIRTFHDFVPLFEEPDLMEMNLGEFEGMDVERWALQNAGFRQAWLGSPGSVKMPGGESLQEVQERAVRALERIAGSYPLGSTLLVCGHSFVNRTLLCHVLNIPLDRFREVRQETATLNVLSRQGQRWVAEIVNEHSHLEKLTGKEIRQA